MIRLPINKSSFTQRVRQKFPTKNHFRISCETILFFYKHSQWATAKTQSRHPIPRDTKETSSGNKNKHSQEIQRQFYKFYLKAWWPGRPLGRTSSCSDISPCGWWVVISLTVFPTNMKTIFASSIFEVFGGTCR